jgi:cytochrome c oxidase cbb3-type subunit III
VNAEDRMLALRKHICRPLTAALVCLLAAQVAHAQQPPTATVPPTALPPPPQINANTPGAAYGHFLQVPINTIIPGAVPVRPQINMPALEDPAAPQRGMMAFNAFNCVGCHMGNGGGGMGPALSAGNFIYGDDPENIYLTIVQGRPRGMPAWGAVLPNQTVWDLVAYIRNLAKAPTPEWGTTVSANSPTIEQVPAELNQSPTPWQQTQPSKNGQKP